MRQFIVTTLSLLLVHAVAAAADERRGVVVRDDAALSRAGRARPGTVSSWLLESTAPAYTDSESPSQHRRFFIRGRQDVASRRRLGCGDGGGRRGRLS